MTERASVDALIRGAFDVDRPLAQRRLDLDRLREQACAHPPDERARARIRALGGALDQALAVEWRPGVGEMHVALTSPCGPSTGRLTVRRGGMAHRVEVGDGIGTSASMQVRAAFDAAAAAVARAGRGVPEARARGHVVELWTPDGTRVDGRSLGLAAAAAFVSCWSGRAPRAEVAASAGVTREGGLVAVDGIEDKVRALRERYPYVRALLVAADQVPALDAIDAVALTRAATLGGALEVLGLDVRAIEGAPLPSAQRKRMLEELATIQVPSYDAGTWREHAMRARMCASGGSASETTRALGWAALFHLHAGDLDDASGIAHELRGRELDALSDGARVWVRIVLATTAIDRDRHDDAVALAREALADAQTLRGDDRAELLGRAYGTLGRALVHAGRSEQAIEPLAAGAAHHREHLGRELARSAIYLATGLRRAGRLDEALDAIGEAFAAIDAHAHEEESAVSFLYARYERGRVRFAREELRAARDDLLALVDAQGTHTYPALGALRYLAAIEQRLGEGDGWRWLEDACEVAEAESTGGALRRVAAAAAGEALLRGGAPPGLEPRLRAVWIRVMGEGAGEAALDRLVY